MIDQIIRVLHVGLSCNLGGIENVVHSWSEVLPDYIHFDFLNNGDCPIAFQKDFEARGCHVYNITSRTKNPLKSYREIYKIISKNRYDYVHHHMMSFSWPEPLMITQHISGSKAIAHCHTAGSSSLSFKYRVLDIYGRRMLSGAPLLRIACGYDAGVDMFHKDRFTVIKNGVNFKDCSFNQNSRKQIRERYKLSESDFVIGHVGRNSQVKNYYFIIDLFVDFIKIRPNSRLMLIGNINDDLEFRNIIRQKKLEKYIIFTGVLSEIKPYYSAMDVFILPSLYEGVSVAMIEAQISGLDCIVSNFVSKDADISGNVKYISIESTEQGIMELINIKHRNRDLDKLLLDNSYDLKITSQKIFNFYEKNLDKVL